MDANSQRTAIAAILTIHTVIKRRQKAKRKLWSYAWLQNRMVSGFYHTTLQEMREHDLTRYSNFLRMDEDSFQEIFLQVAPQIARQDTQMREAISAGERLVVTLRFLATGESFRSLQYLFKFTPIFTHIHPHPCAGCGRVGVYMVGV